MDMEKNESSVAKTIAVVAGIVLVTFIVCASSCAKVYNIERQKADQEKYKADQEKWKALQRSE